MATPYYNPAKFPFQADEKGSISGVSDGQMHYVVQVNGIENGEVLCLPPKALLDGVGIFTGIPAKLPGLSANAIVTLNAKDSAGANIFTAGVAGNVLALLMNTLGVARIPENRTPPATKIGWYDPANPTATKFGALNLTRYDKGQAIAVARDHVTVVEMHSSKTPVIGDWVMGGWSDSAHFIYVVPLLETVTKTNLAVTANDIDPSLMNDWIVEILSITETGTATSVIDADTTLTPGLDSGNQVTAMDNTGNVDITYKHFPLGNIIPLSQMLRLALGKIVYITGQLIGVDLAKVI